MTYVHIFFYKTSCTLTPKNIIYLISKDKILIFKEFKKYIFIWMVTYFTAR